MYTILSHKGLSRTMRIFLLFCASSFLVLLFSDNKVSDLLGIISALFISSSIITFMTRYSLKWLSYPLFFCISVTSYFGLTQVLTGSHAESSTVIFYGLSFYTASIAYLNIKSELQMSDFVKISNPLLIFTGPITLYFRRITNTNIKRRVIYFLPFFVIGIFYFKVVGSPLSVYMYLVDKTDFYSSILFAIIFEIFVYVNFCGLSLIIYSIFGILGVKIPLNFRQPFSAQNIIEFWKGWHTSLSGVLKVLFYTPLRKILGSFGALLAVYMSSAMWHGITINFFIWGLFHALCFYLTLKFLKLKFRLKLAVTIPIMLFGIVVGRLIFADNNTARLMQKLKFENEGLDIFSQVTSVPMASKIGLILGLVFIIIEFCFQNHRLVKKRTYKHLRTPIAQVLLCALIILLTKEVGGAYAIYGQR